MGRPGHTAQAGPAGLAGVAGHAAGLGWLSWPSPASGLAGPELGQGAMRLLVAGVWCPMRSVGSEWEEGKILIKNNFFEPSNKNFFDEKIYLTRLHRAKLWSNHRKE